MVWTLEEPYCPGNRWLLTFASSFGSNTCSFGGRLLDDNDLVWIPTFFLNCLFVQKDVKQLKYGSNNKLQQLINEAANEIASM